MSAPKPSMDDQDAADERTVASTYTRSRTVSDADCTKEVKRIDPVDIEAARSEKNEGLSEKYDRAPQPRPDFPEGGLAAWLTVLGAYVAAYC